MDDASHAKGYISRLLDVYSLSILALERELEHGAAAQVQKRSKNGPIIQDGLPANTKSGLLGLQVHTTEIVLYLPGHITLKPSQLSRFPRAMDSSLSHENAQDNPALVEELAICQRFSCL
jgi:hypothetical protein